MRLEEAFLLNWISSQVIFVTFISVKLKRSGLSISLRQEDNLIITLFHAYTINELHFYLIVECLK